MFTSNYMKYNAYVCLQRIEKNSQGSLCPVLLLKNSVLGVTKVLEYNGGFKSMLGLNYAVEN